MMDDDDAASEELAEVEALSDADLAYQLDKLYRDLPSGSPYSYVALEAACRLRRET
jgi:hypothetical protein